MTKINDDTLRTFVGYHLKRSFNVIQSDLIETLRPFDLRMLTYSALVLIVDNPGLEPIASVPNYGYRTSQFGRHH